MNDIQPRMNKARQDRIVVAARSIAAQDGWEAVTVRRIAAQIGCSAPAIYQYFRDKDAVLAAMAAEAEADLAARLAAATADAGGPGKRLRALAKAQWDFALDCPELYLLLVGGDGVRRAAACFFGPSVMEMWRDAATAWAEKRTLGDKAEDVADQVTALVHGFITLSPAVTADGGRRAPELMMTALDALLRGLDRK